MIQQTWMWRNVNICMHLIDDFVHTTAIYIIAHIQTHQEQYRFIVSMWTGGIGNQHNFSQ